MRAYLMVWQAKHRLHYVCNTSVGDIKIVISSLNGGEGRYNGIWHNVRKSVTEEGIATSTHMRAQVGVIKPECHCRQRRSLAVASWWIMEQKCRAHNQGAGISFLNRLCDQPGASFLIAFLSFIFRKKGAVALEVSVI